MVDRHGLGDHAAHRVTDHVGGIDPEVVEHAGRIVRHVVERVGEVAGDPEHHRRQGGFALVVKHRRSAVVPVVNPDYAETAVGQHFDQGHVPVDHLGAEAGNYKQHGVVRIAVNIKGDFDLTDLRVLDVG